MTAVPAGFDDALLDTARRAVLGWLATVDADGTPNVSPKEVFALVDGHIAVAHIASPATVRNLAERPAVCFSFVDVFVQKGFKLKGRARLLHPDDADFQRWAAPLLAMTQGRFPVHAVVLIAPTHTEPILAPSYRLYPEHTTEASQVAQAMVRYGVQTRSDGAAPPSDADDERLRLVSGFNDLFVVIACVLLLVALAVLGKGWQPWAGALAVAAAAWGLAEIFTRQRRLALPSIVLALAWCGGVLVAGLMWRQGLADDGTLVAAIAATAAAAALHWRRFRVPITVALGCAAAVALALLLLLSLAPGLEPWSGALLSVSGVAVFALAWRWDRRDPTRQTWRADVAFWLHLLAAPLIVHPVFTGMAVDRGLGSSVAVLALYLLLATVSLLLDRRALMVSALAYVVYALQASLEHQGVMEHGLAAAALLIGAALLLLSAQWRGARSLLLHALPVKWRAWLPPAR